ncbi:MAG: DUF418 domain-containing protein [Sphingomonas sp.]|uniref:DUF418 domain-containing protein n=1 Tax=Sphingomonas sp. TaxID=28214 RepID=UPI0025E015BA|nr:DUF418 domain-containing protein [Sphingomonas sp.]MBY0283623.1 DUF418 domain-containing protein [Sphingomonas sp.]
MTITAPVGDRIATLDVVRGVAVMGILIMNIVAFGMPEAAYMNPRAYGGDTGIDLGVYLFNFILFDGKMRGLFSFLFGASALLVIERAQARGASAARVHYARMVWLFLFGVLHLYLIWWGDILNHYALIGLILFFFRNWRPRSLVIAAVVLLTLEAALISSLPLSVAAANAAASKPNATAKELKRRQSQENTFGKPSPKKIAEELRAYRGNYADTVAKRAESGVGAVVGTFFAVGMETLAYMLLGMAMFRTGMLRGEWPVERYRRWVVIGFGIGIPAYAAIGWYMVHAGFTAFSVALGVLALSVPFRPLMIMGWASLIALLARAGGPLIERIGAAGRMAFTNYLMTSILCSTIFYGYGFGLFGYLGRAQLYLVVFGMWALMLLWSKPWLDRYRYGPFEWVWRSLARGAFQPMAR